MSNIIFYHLYCVNDYIDRFYKTYQKIQNSNLYQNVETIFINAVCENKDTFLSTKNKFNDKKINVSNFSTDLTGEMNTLEFMHDVCNSLDKQTSILYLHSKGVTKPQNPYVQSWTDYMEYFLIENWNKCIELLKSYDTCGVNLQYDPAKHYSGNFWWTTANYLQQIPKINMNNCKCTNSLRAYCEFWLLDNDFCRPYSLHNSNIGHYDNLYPKEKYEYRN